MSGFTAFSATIIRPRRHRTVTAAKATDADQQVPGSPFPGCRVYLSRKAEFRGRDEAPQGVVSLQSLVLKIPNKTARVRIGDIVLLPDGLIPGEDRARIQRIRSYPDGFQCDLEAGAVTEEKD